MNNGDDALTISILLYNVEKKEEDRAKKVVGSKLLCKKSTAGVELLPFSFPSISGAP